MTRKEGALEQSQEASAMEQGQLRGRTRLWIWVASGMVALLLVVSLGLSLYLTPERLRRLVLPALEGSLQRDVELRRVGLKLWGGLGVS